jgi:hypothetical protein
MMLISNFPGGWAWLKKIANASQVRVDEKVNLFHTGLCGSSSFFWHSLFTLRHSTTSPYTDFGISYVASSALDQSQTSLYPRWGYQPVSLVAGWLLK